MDDLTLSRFSGRSGEKFRLPDADPPMDFELIEAEPLRSSNEPNDPERNFALLFAGPSDRPLDQQTVALEHDEVGAFALFVVPVAEGDGRRHYEAVINFG